MVVANQQQLATIGSAMCENPTHVSFEENGIEKCWPSGPVLPVPQDVWVYPLKAKGPLSKSQDRQHLPRKS
jgi:hypothetical protein